MRYFTPVGGLWWAWLWLWPAAGNSMTAGRQQQQRARLALFPCMRSVTVCPLPHFPPPLCMIQAFLCTPADPLHSATGSARERSPESRGCRTQKAMRDQR